jgi:hypothetical protein
MKAELTIFDHGQAKMRERRGSVSVYGGGFWRDPLEWPLALPTTFVKSKVINY